jgi:hypothetical protein
VVTDLAGDLGQNQTAELPVLAEQVAHPDRLLALPLLGRAPKDRAHA